MQAAAAQADCDIVLALADIHETWSCLEDWDSGWGRYRRARRWEDDGDVDDDRPGQDGVHELDDLIDSSVTLQRWVLPDAVKAETVSTSFGDDEVCASTPSADLRPYASEYEGYMGNYGNTLDRWYHRGALVVWPRTRAFVVRAEASPSWSLTTLARRARDDTAEARDLAAMLPPIWRSAIGPTPGRGLWTKALRVARALEEPGLAAMLLRPFNVELLAPRDAPALAVLVDTYGERWVRELLAVWSGPHGPRPAAGTDHAAWITTLPRLCAAFEDAADGSGATAARLLVEDAWQWLRSALEATSAHRTPSRQEEARGRLARPLLALLESTAVTGAVEVRDDAIELLTGGDGLLGCLVQVLRAAEGLPPSTRAAGGLDVLAQHCTERLEARLAQPPRAADDWSIDLPEGCDCELCAVLGGFLSDPARRSMDWPLNKERRGHVHGRLDGAELPVRHQTRRTGRPYTLVLTKTDDLFEREAQARRRDASDLVWLSRPRG